MAKRAVALLEKFMKNWRFVDNLRKRVIYKSPIIIWNVLFAFLSCFTCFQGI